MARALIVGCGCRGRALGRRLVDAGWLVRGTTPDPGSSEEALGAGLEAVVADPDRVGTVLEHVADVTLVF
jgi:nucleoside-diphosphate-sugar epimerase